MEVWIGWRPAAVITWCSLNPPKKKALIRHRFRLEDNIKMNLGGLSMEVWIGFSQLRVEAGGGNNMVLTESSGSVKAENFLT
jgi:hypothetical protein